MSSLINRLFIFLIRLYQLLLSPFLGRNCRFSPTCSHYSTLCFKEFPFYKAIWYSTVRILKCHPWNSGGYDPIPGNKYKD